MRFLSWATLGLLAFLVATDANACGGRRRGGCGGAAVMSSYDCGGGGGSGVVYGYAAPAWGYAAPAWQALPIAAPAGGASAALAADRQRHDTAVYAIDPATGALRRVGWLGADGTLRPLWPQASPANPEGGFGAAPK